MNKCLGENRDVYPAYGVDISDLRAPAPHIGASPGLQRHIPSCFTCRNVYAPHHLADSHRMKHRKRP